MKQYLTGLITGIALVTGIFFFLGSTEIQDDSLRAILERLETYIKQETAKSNQSGRYQLQSFSIDRTHWHYLLDTSTGELYRLEPSRTPANAKWVLTAAPNFQKTP